MKIKKLVYVEIEVEEITDVNGDPAGLDINERLDKEIETRFRLQSGNTTPLNEWQENRNNMYGIKSLKAFSDVYVNEDDEICYNQQVVIPNEELWK
jgi:hypothetical protein